MDLETRRTLRLLKVYSGITTALVLVLGLASFRQGDARPKFEEIDVERINIVEQDGRVRLVISNAERAPDAIFEGKSYPRSGGNSAGLTFYNDEGNENGGLYHRGRSTEQGRRASAGLLFDQLDQDQVLGLMYSDDGRRRSAGLYVWDRPETSVTVLADRLASLRAMPESAEKERELASFAAEIEEQRLAGVQRLSVGRTREADATVMLADANGRPRLSLSVTAEGDASLQILDEEGKVTARFPDEQR